MYSNYSKILKNYQNKITKIDKIILDYSKNKSPLIQDICQHLINSGGKRIRPILLIICAKLQNIEINNKILNLAAAIEMIHSATLLHDDVVDNSQMRRNQKTANAIWDNKASILVGDYVFAISFILMVKSDNIKALELLAKTASIMADGEVMQLENSSNININIDQYLKIINGKTAILFASATSICCLLEDSNLKNHNKLHQFGLNLGVIFQIIDDILDYKVSANNLGKDIGDDFFEGKVTLPLILLLQKASTQEKTIINQIHLKNLSHNLTSQENQDNLEYILELFTKYQIFDDSFALAKKYYDKCLKILENFDHNRHKEELITIINYSFSRLN